MNFNATPPPPLDPRDAEALRQSAGRNHQHNVGLAQDVGHLGGWIWAVVRWPFARAILVIRRTRGDA